jgi:acyl-CoA thioesterase-2
MAADTPPPDAVSLGETAGGPTQFFEIQPVLGSTDGESGSSNRLWTRSRVALPDDDIVHACALAYVSDFGSGFAELELEGLGHAGPSLDHCVWFHRPIRLDDWVLVDLWPLRASGSRGTYMGTVHDQAGSLGGVLTQEALLKKRVP